MSDRYVSKIHFQKPSENSQLIENDLQIEVFESMVIKLQTLIHPIGGDAGIFNDPEVIMDLAKEFLADDFISRCINSDFGQGYLLGVLAQMAQSIEEDEEDDDL